MCVQSTAILRGILAVALLMAAAASPAAAQTAPYHGKFTIGVYDAAGQTSLDVNARYSAAAWTGWVGGFTSADSTRQARAGIEYDLHRRGLFVVPSVQVASHGFLGGSVYSELGSRVYLVAGASRTNLHPYVNLTFDPNESWQLGAGLHVSGDDTLAVFTIWDNRLGTGQQISHLVLKHYLPAARRVTVDLSYKSGHGDEDVYRRGDAESVEYDLGRWFVKGAHDRHANFEPGTMWRAGGGFRF